jgi:2'-5' RNA ligase
MNNLIVISLPPEPMLLEFAALSRELSELTGAQVALAYPPHVTLRTGFLIPNSITDRKAWKTAFMRHLSSISPARIQLKGIVLNSYHDQASGSQRYFCGLDVERSPELLNFHQELLGFEPYRKRVQTSYHPHLSLAYKDLSSEGFRKISSWLKDHQELKDENRSWMADIVSVYHECDEKWLPFEEFSLQNSTQTSKAGLG